VDVFFIKISEKIVNIVNLSQNTGRRGKIFGQKPVVVKKLHNPRICGK
jgi:hypothetical protein